VLCKYTLKDDDLVKLRDAIEDLYYFEFVIGNAVCFRVQLITQLIKFMFEQDNVQTNTESVHCILIAYTVCCPYK